MRGIVIVIALALASFATEAKADPLFGGYGLFGNRVMSHYGNFGNRVIGLDRAMRNQRMRYVFPRRNYRYGVIRY